MELTEIRDTIIDGVDLRDVATSMLGLHSQYLGNRMNILCPIPGHNDHSFGSCVVNEKHGYCFACNEGFNAIDLVMYTNNCSFMEAVHLLSDYYGLGIDFRRSVEPVQPFIIPSEVFRYCGIRDTAGFKKFFEQDQDAAFRYLALMVATAKNKYMKQSGVGFPKEISAILAHRIHTLKQADKMIVHWRAEAKTKPLRIKPMSTETK